jgi:hypothetical protein
MPRMTGEHRKRKRRPTSTEEYGAMLRRMIRGYGKRIGTDADPGPALKMFREIEAELAEALNAGLAVSNRAGGHSINELADGLGVSKQAVHNRVRAGEIAAKRKTPRPVRHNAVKAVPRELDAGS